MNILVILTGGTIASTVRDGYIAPDKEKKLRLIEEYNKSPEAKDYKVSFDVKEAFSILSENLTGEYIGRLFDFVESNAIKDDTCDGVIITGGTDTLQYYVTACAYKFADTPVPIVFVSSNKVLEDPRSNGQTNFNFAVRFICEEKCAGVFAVCKNSDNIVYVHRGTRLLPHLPYSSDLFSAGGRIFGCYKNGIWNAAGEQPGKDNEASADGSRANFGTIKCEASGVLRVFPYPGMSYPPLGNAKAVLFDTYHSGTLCSISLEMMAFLDMANLANVPVFLTGASDGANYESVIKWQDRLHVLKSASPIAMYMKLWLLISSPEMLAQKSLYEWMDTEIGGDFIGMPSI